MDQCKPLFGGSPAQTPLSATAAAAAAATPYSPSPLGSRAAAAAEARAGASGGVRAPFSARLNGAAAGGRAAELRGRGLHSSTSQLNLSRFVTDRLSPTSASHRKCANVKPKNDECKPLL